ncbi:MAG: response regulator transcription factor [Peptococcaceae bacterium]|nr:response regulator transcription factor [Peptococcaceae bacterium]
METKILIVDDEPEIINLIRDYLHNEGYQTMTVGDGQAALRMIEADPPDLIILDWMLPGISGLEICRRLRLTSSIPIIMLTAKSEEGDRVLGLELGADDYVVKPFGLRELLARIRTVLRRTSGRPEENDVIIHNELKVDLKGHRVWKKEVEITLTPTEFKILSLLVSRPGVTYSRLQLLNLAMGEEYLYYERSIDTHIFNLRKKIEDDPSNPQYVQTVFGVGYRMGEAL